MPKQIQIPGAEGTANPMQEGLNQLHEHTQALADSAEARQKKEKLKKSHTCVNCHTRIKADMPPDAKCSNCHKSVGGSKLDFKKKRDRFDTEPENPYNKQK